MNTTARYNYFNLFVRVIIGIAAILFIYVKLKENVEITWSAFHIQTLKIHYVVFAFVLTFFNWGLETHKWRVLIAKIKVISFLQAYKLILAGILLSILTPNRVGEIPARAFLLKDDANFKQLTYITFVGAYAQLMITIFMGIIGLWLTIDILRIPIPNTYWMFLFTLMMLILTSLLFSKKIKTFVFHFFKIDPIQFDDFDNFMFAIFISLLRYIIFIIQYYLMLEAFNVHFLAFSQIWLIAVCFLLASIIPTLIISELGVRSSVAIVVFASLSGNAISVISASIMLWVINIGIPACLGIFSLNKIKIKS